MKKRYRCLYLSVFLLCTVRLICLTHQRASAKTVIGGRSMPTIRLAFWQTLCTKEGILLFLIGFLSLIFMLLTSFISSHKKHENQRNDD